MSNPFKKKKSYKQWKAEIGKKKAVKKTKTSAKNLGKHIHNNLEERDLTTPLSKTPNFKMGAPYPPVN